MLSLSHKIPPPLVAIITAALMWLTAKNAPVFSMNKIVTNSLSLLMLTVGVLVCGLGVYGFYRAKTTVNPLQPDKATTLVDSGIYRFSRNPMYLGFVFMLLAWAVYLSSLWSLVLIATYIVYMQAFQIKPEEEALEKIFGDEFAAYCQRVRRWI